MRLCNLAQLALRISDHRWPIHNEMLKERGRVCGSRPRLHLEPIKVETEDAQVKEGL